MGELQTILNDGLQELWRKHLKCFTNEDSFPRRRCHLNFRLVERKKKGLPTSRKRPVKNGAGVDDVAAAHPYNRNESPGSWWAVGVLNLLLPSSISQFSQPFVGNCILSQVVRIGSITIFRMCKLSYVLHTVFMLILLEGCWGLWTELTLLRVKGQMSFIFCRSSFYWSARKSRNKKVMAQGSTFAPFHWTPGSYGCERKFSFLNKSGSSVAKRK